MNDNKLIAEFMGMQHTDIGWYDSENVMSEYACQMVGGNTFEELQYDRSWDWLMPVVDKINGFTDDEGEFLYEVKISPSRCIISRGLSTIVDQPNGEDMKQMVYIAVVEFIKEYNLKS